MKNSKCSQKGLKFQYVALNVACWMQKKVLSWNKLNNFEIFVLLKLKLSKNKKYSKFIIRGRQRNPLQECDICLLQQAEERHLSHQLQ